MSNYRRATAQGATWFFTVVTYRRQPILCHDNIRTALRQAIGVVRQQHPFTIDGWVLLPDHLHCIWTLPPGDAGFGVRWAMIKRFVTKRCGAELRKDEWMTPSKQKRNESTIWQRRFWEHQIRDDRDYEIHMDYLHYNPVKHGLTENVRDWPYSTFHRYVQKGVYTKTWGSDAIANNGNQFGE